MSCFESENHRWGMAPIGTSVSEANHAVLHAQNDRRGLWPIEIRYSGRELAILQSKITDEDWDP